MYIINSKLANKAAHELTKERVWNYNANL